MLHGLLQPQRQAPHRRRAGHRLAQVQYHPPAAAHRQRIDAQRVVIALGVLQQRRVDAAAHDVLEGLPAFHLVHRHGVAQFPVDVEREAGDRLPFLQRELELRFERTGVGVVQLEFDAGGGRMADDVGLHRDAAQFDGLARFVVRYHDAQRRCVVGQDARRGRLRLGEAGVERGGGTGREQHAPQRMQGAYTLEGFDAGGQGGRGAG